MESSPDKIADEDFTIDQIMDKIRENIRKGQEENKFSGTEPAIPTFPLNQYRADPEGIPASDLFFLNTNWDIHNNSYTISSHRPYIGAFLVKGRQLVHGEVRRYVDSMIHRQTEFNAGVVRTLNWTTQTVIPLQEQITGQEAQLREQREQITGQEAQLREQREQITGQEAQLREQREQITGQEAQLREQREQIAGQEAQLREQRASIERLQREMLQLTDNALSRIDAEITKKTWLANALDTSVGKELSLLDSRRAEQFGREPSPSYFSFEEKFRGSRQTIKERQSVFLSYFDNCSGVLDIGCGRGEFLEALKETGIGARGIDTDTDMVEYCRSRKLDVEQADALSYLEGLPDKSLDGIFLDQVVEHVSADYLIKMLQLSYRKLKHGYYIIVETVNPLSFVSFVNFYIDMTHTKPIHPETLTFIMESLGFRSVELRFSTPVSDDFRLKKVEVKFTDTDSDYGRDACIYNQNIDILNNILFGHQDYAVIGKK